MKKEQEDYGLKLQESYDRWAHIYEHGTSDPSWEDGVNLNLVRNHIIYYHGKLEENPTLMGYPAAYLKELPPLVDQRYMARPDEIRAAARASLARYQADPNYQYLVQHREDFTRKTRNKLAIDNVIGYATGLERYIKEDRLVDMRRHEHCDHCLKSFEECVGRMRKAPPEVVQRSLFSLTVDPSVETGDGEDDFDEDGNEENDEPETETDGEIIPQNDEKADYITEEGVDRAHDDGQAAQRVEGGKAQPADRSPYDNIPAELKSLNQWCVYRTYPDRKSGKLKKVIISPYNSMFAHSDMPETWVSYGQAKAYAERYRHYKGLVFALDKGIMFIDIDHAVNKDTGEIISPEAKRLLELLPDTYSEVSTSGTGLHILLKGSLPADAYRRNDKNGIEMYDTRRFVCMTGDTLNGSREIKDYTDRIAGIAYEFAGRRLPRTEYAAQSATQTDQDLMAQIVKSRSAVKFQALYGGDTFGYPSWSHAESALVFMLAWWTRDPAQIDSIVRSSGLIRPKWDDRRGAGTYGSQLIDEALSIVQPREKRQRKSEYYL
ncbi:hypothetical protein FACS1894211_00770 [Clostridia bacterium]|nr:hypothetical protein FACS1894211_00770 [Clostridia bacterium]